MNVMRFGFELGTFSVFRNILVELKKRGQRVLNHATRELQFFGPAPIA